MMGQRKAVSSGLLFQPLLVLGCLFVAALFVAACSSMTGTLPASGMATVNTMISDPATCAAPDGPYSHVYVTITDVQANLSASAGDNDGGWVDLTPNLKKTPKQVDLLGRANNQCFLASLGDSQQLQAGTYQQIRLILADNSLSISGNMCGSSANCVVLNSDQSNPRPLQLSSEAKTGLKIPSGQIAKGGFTIAAGETKDLDIDFNTCSSIVREGNGQFRLKPVLHAGEVGTISASINGRVLDKATGNAVNGSVTVNLEQKDKSGIDRIVMSTMAGADGSFVFCPLPAGSYDVVVIGTRADGAFYDPTIVTGVNVGSTTGTLNLYMPTTAATSGANLTGLVTSQTSAMGGSASDVTLSAFESVNSVTYTIPLPPTATQPAATLAVTTAASTTSLSCPTGTYCATYTMQLPSGGPYVGAWSASGAMLTQSAPLATYVVDGIATVPSSGGSDCSLSELQSTPPSMLTGAGPYNVAVPNLPFTSCQ
jgi:hypothetical protein